MPILVIETIQGTINQAQKKKIVDAVTAAEVKMGVLVERINVIFHDNPASNWAVGGKFQTEEKKPPVLISVEVFPELFFEKQRNDIINALTPVLEAIGFVPERTNVCFRDNPMKMWAVAGVFQSKYADKIPPLK